MKYKIGDRVKLIKKRYFCHSMKEFLDELPGRIAIIEWIDLYGNQSSKHIYTMTGVSGKWSEEEIERLVTICAIFEPIENRWELLDL